MYFFKALVYGCWRAQSDLLLDFRPLQCRRTILEMRQNIAREGRNGAASFA
jgi:hypothetical protein